MEESAVRVFHDGVSPRKTLNERGLVSQQFTMN